MRRSQLALVPLYTWSNRWMDHLNCMNVLCICLDCHGMQWDPSIPPFTLLFSFPILKISDEKQSSKNWTLSQIALIDHRLIEVNATYSYHWCTEQLPSHEWEAQLGMVQHKVVSDCSQGMGGKKVWLWSFKEDDAASLATLMPKIADFALMKTAWPQR